MALLRHASIKQKLMRIIILTSSLALLLGCLTFVAYEVFQFRRSMGRDLETLAQIVAENVSPSLSFIDTNDAQGILKSLRAKPNITSAQVFATNGALFARYPAHAPAIELPPKSEWTKQPRFRGPHLELYYPIQFGGETIGTLYLQSDLQELSARLRRYPAIIGGVMLLSMAAALLLSTNLQKVISQPISHLAATARRISENRNYSVRAVKETHDEIGHLIDAFNDMLGQIQQRDAALQQARDFLEERVAERTRELQAEIQERKQTYERLQTLAAKLEQSNNELRAFAYVASHDLQEPLRKVQAFGDRLKASCASAFHEEGRDYLERMLNAARRMQNLINDLLLFSRVSTQASPFRSIDLRQVVQEVLSDLEVRIQQTGGRVELGELSILEADPMQMRQLFQNLISNALKFHRPGVAPEVKIRSEMASPPAGSALERAADDKCRIFVEDNGIGFDEKYRDRIFGVFQRLHGRQTYEGTGIGLAICRKIAERHGGTITAQSIPGQGATFVVTLPLKHHTNLHEN